MPAPARPLHARLIVAAVIAVWSSAVAAGDGQTDLSTLRPLDIPTRSGTLTVQAPPGATATLISGSMIDIDGGTGFRILVAAGIGVLSRSKQDVEAGMFGVLKRYVLDEPPLGMIFETEVGGAAGYHYYFIVRGVFGGLVCQDPKGPAFPIIQPYTESEARAMYAACKTVQLKP